MSPGAEYPIIGIYKQILAEADRVVDERYAADNIFYVHISFGLLKLLDWAEDTGVDPPSRLEATESLCDSEMQQKIFENLEMILVMLKSLGHRNVSKRAPATNACLSQMSTAKEFRFATEYLHRATYYLINDAIHPEKKEFLLVFLETDGEDVEGLRLEDWEERREFLCQTFTERDSGLDLNAAKPEAESDEENDFWEAFRSDNRSSQNQAERATKLEVKSRTVRCKALNVEFPVPHGVTETAESRWKGKGKALKQCSGDSKDERAQEGTDQPKIMIPFQWSQNRTRQDATYRTERMRNYGTEL